MGSLRTLRAGCSKERPKNFDRNCLTFDLACYAFFSYSELADLSDQELKKLWRENVEYRTERKMP